MGDRTPGIGVTPGAAAAHSPRSGLGTPRIPRRRALVVGLVEPVAAPLVAHAREIGEPQRIGRRLADAGRTLEREAGARVAPRVARLFEAAARGSLPLRLRRQPRPGPRRERLGLGPREADDGLTRPARRGGGPEGG